VTNIQIRMIVFGVAVCLVTAPSNVQAAKGVKKAVPANTHRTISGVVTTIKPDKTGYGTFQVRTASHHKKVGVNNAAANGGNGGRITLNQAWALLQKIEGVNLPAKYGPPRNGDVRDSQADTTLAVRDLRHTPRFSFEEGMKITLEWYRHNR